MLNTPNYALPSPEGGDPADAPTQMAALANKVDQQLKAVADALAASITDQVANAVGLAPIGAQILYTGSGDPPEGEWVIADGRLIDRTTYADFFNRTGHAYNNGIDPGSNKVRIPDKRGKKSMGAISMGTDGLNGVVAVPASNARANVARGTSGGEVNHTLSVGEMPSHSHRSDGGAGAGGVTAGMNANVLHNHPTAGDGNVLGSGSAFPTTANVATVGGGAYGQAQFPLQQANLDHGHPITANGGGAVHNNLDPYEADSYIVRIA